MHTETSIAHDAQRLSQRYEALYEELDASSAIFETLRDPAHAGLLANPILARLARMDAIVTRFEMRQDLYFNHYFKLPDNDDSYHECLRAICRIIALEIALINAMIPLIPTAKDLIDAHDGAKFPSLAVH